MSKHLLNFTELDEKEAMEKLTELRDLVLKGESDRTKRVERFVENNDIWLNNIWSEDDLAFFDSLDITPYEFPVQRPLINNLITRQRRNPVSFDIVPTDLHSYKRQRKGREQFVAEEMAKENSAFVTPEDAGEFYDKYADDEYAKAASVYLHNIRHESKATRVDTAVFQQGLISGLDFWKATYSKKFNRSGSVEISRRPQNAIFYDESSVESDLSDVEFIGEVHRMYKQNLVLQYPDKQEEIEEYFSYYTNRKRRTYSREQEDWKFFYDFRFDHAIRSRLHVAEIYFLETEARIEVIDNNTQETKIVEFEITEDEVYDKLMSMMLLELQDEAVNNPQVAESLQGDDVRETIMQMVEERYTIQETIEPVWYKAVFSYNALFEYKRTELPHNSHPYFPFFAQFTEGEFRGILDDIKDVIISINKALAFRELMMAHGAKNVLIVDERAIAASGYSIDKIAESWTSVGSIIALKLKTGQRMGDVFQNVNTVGDALPAINALLADLDNRLYQISGVNLAQLGVVERETTGIGFRDQVRQGEANNGMIYDNFYAALECFYGEKVVPLVVELMRIRKDSVIRQIGDEYSPWLEVDLEENYDLFESAIRNGTYNTVVKPKTDSAQLQEERSARYMEMAMAGLMDPEIAIEFSADPDRHKILKKMREKELERVRRQAFGQFSFQEFMQLAAQSNLPAEAIEELVDKMKKAQIERQASNPLEGEQIQRRQGGQGAQAAPAIGQAATESARINNMERAVNYRQTE
jgi:hypothetical protein